MRALGWTLIMACAVVPMATGSATARPAHHRHRAAVRLAPPTPPSQDAIELATLAPPSELSTIEQTYGDAAIARRRVEGRVARELQADQVDAAAFGGAPYPCPPRTVGSTASACNAAPHPFDDREGYAFTAAFFSAPQRVGVPADEQTRVLSPITGLAWAINRLGDDPRN